MIGRHLQRTVERLLGQFPAVALLGPRQSGKTTLAHVIGQSRPAVYLDLEADPDRAKLSEPELYLRTQSGKLVILDEIQHAPDLFRPLRGLIDEDRRRGNNAGQFLILGSASIELLKQSSETLAGRIAFAELGPLSVREVDPGDLDTLWIRGGFPDSFLAADDGASLTWRHNFIRTYLERHIPQLGPRIPAETLRRFLTMLAHHQGGPLNAAQLAAGLGISGKTVGRYLDLLVDLLLVRRLPPWARNIGKRLVRSPRVYLGDTGILHALLGIADQEALLGHPIVGPSWEGFVIENIVMHLPDTWSASYYRTLAQAEIDLVLESTGARRRLAIEIKRTLSPKPSRGFHNAARDIAASDKYCVVPIDGSYPLGDGTRAIGLLALLADLEPGRTPG